MVLDEVMIVVTIAVWLSCGLAATCLAPGNAAARSLLAAGLLLGSSRAVEVLLLTATTDSLTHAVLRTVGEAAFLGALVAVVMTLVRYPDGTADERWHVAVVRALAIAALLAPVAELMGSATLEVGNEPSTARTNPVAAPALAPLGAVGSLVAATEPLWIVLGVVLLCVRWWRGDRELRGRLVWPLASLLLLAALLAVVAVGAVTRQLDIPVPLFLVALSLFPVALLVGITQRTRTLERRLVESRARLANAEDAARRALERDLHDGAQQQLVAILSLSELAGHQAVRDPEEARRTMREVTDQARLAIVDLRELVRGIRPPVLQDAGLAAALESRLARVPADVRLDAGAVGPLRWPPAVESAAYFVVSEAVTNALKFAPGSEVRVRLTGGPRELVVEVQDEGPGVQRSAAHGHGLTGLRDRVESLRGSFEVRSAPGAGTTVRARFAGAALDAPEEVR